MKNKNSNINKERGDTFVGYRPNVIRIKQIQDKLEKMKQEKE